MRTATWIITLGWLLPLMLMQDYTMLRNEMVKTQIENRGVKGLRVQAVIEEKNIPWAWGINGCMSVISAALATLLTVETGFSTVIMLAAICYAVSMMSVYLVRGRIRNFKT